MNNSNMFKKFDKIMVKEKPPTLSHPNLRRFGQNSLINENFKHLRDQ